MIKFKKDFIETADTLVVTGAFLTGAGIWQVYRPAAFIFVGLCCLTAGIIGLRR